MGLSVSAHVSSVAVREKTRVDHRVVQGGVESGLVRLRAAADRHLRKCLPPGAFGPGPDLVKPLSGDLFPEVVPGAFQIDEGNADPEGGPLAGAGGEFGEKSQVRSPERIGVPDDRSLRHPLQVGDTGHVLPLPGLVRRNVRTPETAVCQGFVKLCMKVHRVQGIPRSVAPAARGRGASHPTFERVVIDDPDKLFLGSAAHPPGEIHLDTGKRALGPGEPEDAAAGRGGALDPDVVIGQKDGVIPRGGGFRGLVVERTPAVQAAVLLPGDLFQRPGRGHDEEIAQVSVPANSAHLGHRKSFDGAHLIAVSGPVVPSGHGVGAYLDHPERGRRPRKRLSKAMGHPGDIRVRACPDERIDIPHGILAAGSESGGQEQARQDRSHSFHRSSDSLFTQR